MGKNRTDLLAKAPAKRPSISGNDHSTNGGSDRLSADIQKPKNPSRRSFLGKVGGAAAVAATASSIVLKPLLGGKDSTAFLRTLGLLKSIPRLAQR